MLSMGESAEQFLGTEAFSKVQTSCVCSNIMFEISQRLSHIQPYPP